MTDADMDLRVCELQHRVDELLSDNDTLQSQVWAKDRVILILAEKIAELEDR